MKKLIYAQAQFLGKVLKIQWDKILHFEVGFIFNSLVFAACLFFFKQETVFADIFVAFPFSLIATGLLGLAKELYDQRTTGFSEADIKATVYGGLFSSLVIILIILI